jgi:predicted metal-binding membrane protein
MTAAMMFPSVAPTVALYAQMTRSRSAVRPLLFAAGYLAAWVAVGVGVFALAFAGRRFAGDVFEWSRAGRWASGALVLVAAVYEFTPFKDACLSKCRNPVGILIGARRLGGVGAAATGMKTGLWCIGCCWALMASLFALGIMSIVWMALIAAVITAEKLLPWRRAASYATAAVLVVIALFILVAPAVLPGLTIPSMMRS